LTHYVLEAVPALAIGLTALAYRFVRWPRAGSPLAWPASLGALLALVLAAEAVLILPAEEAAFLSRGRPANLYAHSFSYAALPAYYGRWLSGGFDGSLPGFPGPMRGEMAGARGLAGTPSLPRWPLPALGGRSWFSFL